MLKTGSVATARTSAFAVLVFSELFRAFGARSETKPLWRIPPFLNFNLVTVVVISLALQIGSQHNALLGRLLKSSYLPFADCPWFHGRLTTDGNQTALRIAVLSNQR